LQAARTLFNSLAISPFDPKETSNKLFKASLHDWGRQPADLAGAVGKSEH
jgi:hypothetical protein